MRRNGKVAATLYPRIQINPAMGGFLASPDIKKNFDRDIYTHVSATMNREDEPTWGKGGRTKVKIGQQFFINDYVAVLEQVKPIGRVAGVELAGEDVAVKAKIKSRVSTNPFMPNPSS